MRPLPLALVACVGLSCGKRPPAAPIDDNPGMVTVFADRALLRSGPIGTAGSAEASYVLVDARNDSGTDRWVVLDGRLVDGLGTVLAGLAPDEMRIPARSGRTFALVADALVPTGRVEAKVLSARTLDYPAEIRIEDPREKRGELMVATATATNGVERAASVVLACSFHDATGQLLARPFTVVDLEPGAKQTVRFEGPKSAATASIFVGQVAFKP